MPKVKRRKLNNKPKEKLFCPRSCIRYDKSICGTCWVCKMCQKCLLSREAVENHVKDCNPYHVQPKIIIKTEDNEDEDTCKRCEHCEKTFSSRAALECHVKEHLKSDKEDSDSN